MTACVFPAQNRAQHPPRQHMPLCCYATHNYGTLFWHMAWTGRCPSGPSGFQEPIGLPVSVHKYPPAHCVPALPSIALHFSDPLHAHFYSGAMLRVFFSLVSQTLHPCWHFTHAIRILCFYSNISIGEAVPLRKTRYVVLFKFSSI